MVQFSQEQKKDAVIELSTRKASAATFTDRIGTSRSVILYKWKKDLLGKENVKAMERSIKSSLPEDKNVLLLKLSR